MGNWPPAEENPDLIFSHAIQVAIKRQKSKEDLRILCQFLLNYSFFQYLKKQM